jgi:hypothetical protein
MADTLLGLVLVVAILGLSALLTHWFARAMYVACSSCHTLNARRRTHCRECGEELRR